MITAEEYAALTGLDAPEAFPALEAVAEELLHARTLQQFRRTDIPTLPMTTFKRALALQISFMESRGGQEAWADPTMLTAEITLGRFSIHNGGTSSAHAEAALLAPAAAALLPTLMSYARAWMGGECP